MINLGSCSYTIVRDDRIGRMVIQKVCRVNVKSSKTVRAVTHLPSPML